MLILLILYVAVFCGCNTNVQTDEDPLSAILYAEVSEHESTDYVREEFESLFDNIIYDKAEEVKSDPESVADSVELHPEAEAPEVAQAFAYTDADSDVVSIENETASVWIPASGTKYHSKPDCSGMKNPSVVSESQAQPDGYTKCKRCFK